VLGLPVVEAWEQPTGSGAVLDAGRATLELLSTAQAALVDQVEVGSRVAGPVRIALEVDDAAETAGTLVAGGAERLGGPVVTPWSHRNVRLRAPDGTQLTLFTVLDAEPVPTTLRLAQDADADALLARDPLALLVGMLLDQQFPMERAFAGPYLLARRLSLDTLDAGAIAAHDPDALAKVMAGPPAVHRYPAAMAGRVQALCRLVAEQWGGDAAELWRSAATGRELLARLRSLPGFGEQKARIFVALLGKQLGVQPPGWREAAGPYGEEGSHRSVADVTDADSLAQVRAFKQATKQAAPRTR